MYFHIALSAITPNTYRVINSDTHEEVEDGLTIHQATELRDAKNVEVAEFRGLFARSNYTWTAEGEVA